MSSRQRLLIASLGFVLASFVAGCGGGGGSPGPAPSPTQSALAVTTRPLTSGDTFSYAGTTTQSFVYSGTSPEPQSTTVYAIAQAVAVAGPGSYGSASSAYDATITETDTSPLQAIGLTTNSYYALLTSGATTDLVTYGYTSSDTNGESLAVTIPNVNDGNGLLDELPEKAGQRWSNGAAQTANETSPGGYTSVRTTAADGSYTDTTNVPVGSIYPSPSGAVATSATITQKSDGSGSYVFEFESAPGAAAQTYDELDFATPAPASSGVPSTIAVSQPQATGAPVVVSIPVWYPQPLKLYTETDTDTGATALPAACKVPATFGTEANSVVQTIVQYDTILGTQENFSQTNYVVPSYGLACVVLSEKLLYFYDYSGQSAIPVDLAPNANVTADVTLPIETETIATTLGLTQSNVTAAVRSARGATAGALDGLRVTSARANFLALVEREKVAHKVKLLQKLGALLERLHR
jgi:hypothetical protein